MAKAIDALTSGFEGMVCPTLDMISTHLTEIKQSQHILQQLLKEQNEDWKKMPYVHEIEQIFAQIPNYILKTKDTQKEMHLIQDRVEKLKKRSEKLLVQ
jgi:prephenate dehydratase